MTIPNISALPVAPSPTDERAVFNTKAFNLWLAQQGLVTEINAAMDAFEVDAATAASSATAAANSAATAASSATAAANSAAAAVGSAPFTHLACASVVASASVTTVNGVRAISLDASRDLVLVATNNGLFGVVYDASSATFGTVVLVRSGVVASKGHLRLVSAGTDKVLVTSCISQALLGVVLSVTGTSIAVGTAASVTLSGSSVGNPGLAPLVAVGAAWVQGYSKGNYTVGYVAITVSGTTVTMGAEVTEATGSPSAQPIIFGIDSTRFLAITAGSTQMYARPHTVSGTTITPGTLSGAVSVSSTIVRAAYLPASGRWLLQHGTSVALVSVSGTAASVSVSVSTGNSVVGASSVTVIAGQPKAFLCGPGYVAVVTDNAGTPVVGTVVYHQLSTAVCVASDASTVTLAGRDGAAAFSESGGSPVFLWHRFPGPFNTNSATYHAEVGGTVTDASRVMGDLRSDLLDSILVGSECATLLPHGTAQPFVMTVRGQRSESRLSAGVSVGANAERISRVSNSVAWLASAAAIGSTRIQLEKIQSL